MKILFATVIAALLSAAPAHAQVQVQITMGLPAVLPPMVVVQPGVQVVSGLDEEVYFVDGWYWVRRGPHWYRARDHRRSWVWIAPQRVPVMLTRIPPGQYRRLDRERWQREHREWKQERRAEHARWKEEREELKREKHDHHHGRDGDERRDRDRDHGDHDRHD